MAQAKKDKRPPRLYYLLIITAVLLATVVILILLLKNNTQDDLNDDATSTRNISLMNQAIHDRDIMACDQISGDINYTNPNTIQHSNGLSMGVAIITPAMTEAEAEQECRSRIHLLIDQKKYEDKVCADESINHYKFGDVTWPCPED